MKTYHLIHELKRKKTRRRKDLRAATLPADLYIQRKKLADTSTNSPFPPYNKELANFFRLTAATQSTVEKFRVFITPIKSDNKLRYFLLLARYVPNAAKEEYMRSV